MLSVEENEGDNESPLRIGVFCFKESDEVLDLFFRGDTKVQRDADGFNFGTGVGEDEFFEF